MPTLAETVAPTPSPLLYIIAAVLAGGLLEFLWRVYQRWRHGGSEDALEIAHAAQEQSQNSNVLWQQYKVELEDAKEQLNAYLKELVSVNRELGRTLARVSKLEEDLRDARQDNQRLREELAGARTRRDELIERVTDLQERIRVIEGDDAHGTAPHVPSD